MKTEQLNFWQMPFPRLANSLTKNLLMLAIEIWRSWRMSHTLAGIAPDSANLTRLWPRAAATTSDSLSYGIHPEYYIKRP